MTVNEQHGHDDDQPLHIIRLTAPDDPKKVIGYAMAQQIDFVARRAGLTGAAREALEAAEQAFARAKTLNAAVALPPHKTTGTKMFAMIGSGNNNAA